MIQDLFSLDELKKEEDFIQLLLQKNHVEESQSILSSYAELEKKIQRARSELTDIDINGFKQFLLAKEGGESFAMLTETLAQKISPKLSPSVALASSNLK